MISVRETVIERVTGIWGDGKSSLADLAVRVARDVVGGLEATPGGVIAATFSNPVRFPSLAVAVASALKLPTSVPAFDLQLACSAYPYAVYLASRLAADVGRPVVVIDGDVQTPLVDQTDHATGAIFSDAVTATVVGVRPDGESVFDFLSAYDEALVCGAQGPIRMDGFKVFSFVATQVTGFLRPLAERGGFDVFAPHQANPYMVRQLARSLGLADRLLTLDDKRLNPGSCSIPMMLAEHAELAGKGLFMAGFGAGYSASAGIVRLGADFVPNMI